ncbi:MAG: hypothetical protein RR942_03385 [Romboutsia sp.]
MLNLILNNNPNCKCSLENTVKDELFELENKPFIIVEGNNIDLDHSNIKVVQGEKVLFSGNVEVNNNSFRLEFELEKVLGSTNNIKVILDNYEQVFNIKLKKLYGKATYLNKMPVKNPIISCTNSNILTVGDEDGNFELLLSHKEDSIGIFDSKYSKEMLEVWVYNVNLESDLRINAEIDKCEVYGIRMWQQECSTYIHFIPMSILRVNEIAIKTSKKESELILNKHIWPNLKKEDIEIYCNDKQLEILAFSQIDDFLGNINGKNIYRNGYIVSVDKIKTDELSLIKIRFKDTLVLNGKTNVGIGEGYYLLKQ